MNRVKNNQGREQSAPEPLMNVQTIFGQFAARVRENARQSARLGARFNRLQDMVASRRRQLEVSGRATELTSMLALSVEAYNLVSRHAIACVDDLLTLGESALGMTLDGAPQVEGPSRTVLSCRPGESVEAKFVIQNEFDFSVSFRLRLVPLWADEISSGKISLRVTPDSAELEPASHQEVLLKAELAEDLLPDTYLAQVVIEGMPHAPETSQSSSLYIELRVAS